MVKRGLLLAGVITLFAALLPLSVHADETASSTFSIDVSDAALQVTAPDTANIILDPASSKFFGNTNITVNVATNNMTGYTMTMSVPTTDLAHTEFTGSNAPIIPTLQSAAPESTFPANAWGYKVLGDNYNPVQLTNTNPSWQTDGPTNGTDHIIGLAAKVDGVKHSGTYTNTLTFNVVANPNANKDTISFDKNNENATGSMPDQTIYQDGVSKINPNTFQLSGMQFMGWSTTASGAGTDVKYYGDNTIYISPNPGQNNNVILYAQWAPAGTPTSTNPSGVNGTTFARAYEIAYTAMKKGMYEQTSADSTHYETVDSWNTEAPESYKGLDVRFAMQDMTPEICTSVTVMHDDYQALDIRDDKLYHITKTMDGNCWMTQNLALDLVHEENDADTKLDHSNTDLGWTNWDENAKWNPSRSFVTDTQGFNEPFGVNSLKYDKYVYNGSTQDVYNSLEEFKNRVTISPELYSHYATGNYYSWSAAVATNDTSSSFYTTYYNDAPDSICPAGWRLPHGLRNGNNDETSVSDYGILLYKEGITPTNSTNTSQVSFTENGFNLMRNSPLYFVLAGYVPQPSFNSPYYIGYVGEYFTNTITGHATGYWWYAFGMTAYRDGPRLYPHNHTSARMRGQNIRCIAR